MDNPSDDVYPVVKLALLSREPRLRPSDPRHVRRLMQVLNACPPIIVTREGMRVLDGMMRVEAADLCGRETLPVTWVVGDDATLLAIAVSANATHGLPLTYAQRKAAAGDLLAQAPWWASRRIARTCGISEATVRRMRSPASKTHLNARLGSDGKTYPLPAAQHERACEQPWKAPALSDRDIARASDLSTTTAGPPRSMSESVPTPHPASAGALRRVFVQIHRWLRRALRLTLRR